jgi:hypothetical protein
MSVFARRWRRTFQDVNGPTHIEIVTLRHLLPYRDIAPRKKGAFGPHDARSLSCARQTRVMFSRRTKKQSVVNRSPWRLLNRAGRDTDLPSALTGIKSPSADSDVSAADMLVVNPQM